MYAKVGLNVFIFAKGCLRCHLGVSPTGITRTLLGVVFLPPPHPLLGPFSTGLHL